VVDLRSERSTELDRSWLEKEEIRSAEVERDWKREEWDKMQSLRSLREFVCCVETASRKDLVRVRLERALASKKESFVAMASEMSVVLVSNILSSMKSTAASAGTLGSAAAVKRI